MNNTVTEPSAMLSAAEAPKYWLLSEVEVPFISSFPSLLKALP